MLRFDSTTVLQAVLAGAITSVQPIATVCYNDDDATNATYAGGRQTTALNSTTDVTIASAPAAGILRDIDYLSILNRDTASITVTVKWDVGGTDSPILTVTILTGELLIYTHSDGWRVMTTTGAIKTPGGTVTSVAFTAAPASIFDVSGSPITTSGTIALSMDNQNANVVIAGPASGAAAPPTARALVVDDGLSYEADGRLTLTSAMPVMTSDVTASTSIFYALYTGNKIALYDGTSWVNTTFTELTNTTTDNTKNPAAVANNSNYDLFVWNDGGTIRLGRGPAWTSDTARGTGAGTTELERVNGVLVNKIAITNGPAAQRGRYVGSVRSNGTASIDWKLGGTAANGAPGFLYVWNMYNRVNVGLNVVDSTDSWNYSTLTWRSKNNSTSNRVSMIRGLDEDAISVYNVALSANDTGGAAMFAGIGIDSTSAFSGTTGFANLAAANQIVPPNAKYDGMPGLGHHFVQALEAASAVGTTTWQGDGGAPTFRASGLSVNARA